MTSGPLAAGQQSFGPSLLCMLQLPPTPVTRPSALEERRHNGNRESSEGS